VRAAIQDDRHADLTNYEKLDAGAPMSVPTPEHYLPLLYVLALRRAGESVRIPVDGIELGAVSMMCVQLGG
jgi:4,5-DOPA dioxygenase extradiol